jgi:Histone methylation protein DOT1
MDAGLRRLAGMSRATVRTLRRKLARTWKVRGPWGTVRELAKYPLRLVRLSAEARSRNAIQTEFDKLHNTDTSGLISLSELDVESPNWVHGYRYGPTAPETFRSLLKLLAIDFSKFTFIDFGSGKGAVLLYASEYPFREVIGVEFSRDLHHVAEANIAVYPAARQSGVRPVWCDAVEFQIPPAPLCVFFNNPFSREIMSQVVANIAESHRHAPREVYLLTANIAYELESLTDNVRALAVERIDGALCRAYVMR